MKKGKMKRQWKRNIWQPWIESNAFYPVFTPQSQTLFLFLPCLVLASTMRRGAKRKTKQGQEAKHDAPEDNKPKAQHRAKRAKTSKPQSEPKYFEDKRNLVSLVFWFQFEPFSLTICAEQETLWRTEWNAAVLFIKKKILIRRFIFPFFSCLALVSYTSKWLYYMCLGFFFLFVSALCFTNGRWYLSIWIV